MRQLAAILFADMLGYTALMQENEHLAGVKRRRMKEVLDQAVVKANGKVIQFYGDGSLSIFNSAIDSVRCAIDIQQQLQQEPRVELRIGIHTGDVTMEEDSIYGDGVNLASRIESMGIPGGILISEKVYDEIKNQENISTREMGFFELKNVTQPVKIYAISNAGLVVPGRDDLRGKTKQTSNRLAVLPFVNLSADPENEYFSDGITEELLNALTRVDGLRITSRTSSFAFKGKNHDIRDIGIQLNVDKLLEGSVRKSGNLVRITAQLINAADGYHIWSESYDRDLTDIFMVQDEISQIIANKLRENLTPTQKAEHIVKPSTSNIDAYTLYLKGVHCCNKLTPADSKKGIACFEEAIKLEPGYAQAYAMAAGAYAYLGATGQLLPENAYPIVKEYAHKALELDSENAESHIAMASNYLFHEFKWKEGFESLQRALQLNPGAIEAYELLGYYYMIMGNPLEAVRVMKEAVLLDPLSPIVLSSLGSAYFFSEQYDEVIKECDKLLELDPNSRSAIEQKAYAIGMKGDWKKALELFKEVHRLTKHPLKGLMGLGYTYGRLGMIKEAMDVVEKLERRQQEEPGSVIDADLAAVWIGIGDLDKAVHHIEQSSLKGMGPVNYFHRFPPFRSVSSHPKFQELRKKFEKEGKLAILN
ncbi:MAG TPA: adenylate/guanylate cyclase domain-containing protein [Chitinophagaceae bacterium]|nr:adenylate/guanylate cyclase domain-containing protein [Chitinophagaceae bacterium]